jgi:hypothetical protein
MATRSLTSAIRVHRLVLVLVVTALAVSTLSLQTSAAHADSNGGGSVGWQYDETGKGFYQAPTTGHGGDSDPVFFREWGSTTDWNCNPIRDCNGIGGLGCPEHWGGSRAPTYAEGDWEYARADAGDQTKWHLQGIDCLPTPVWVPIEQVGYQFEYDIQRLLPKPSIELRPEPETLVNLPTIVSTDYPTEKTFGITVPPSAGRPIALHGTINAHAELTWTFEDGTTASGPGNPYDGTDPEIDPGHYLTDTFRTAGHHTVTLTVTWTGTITVETLAPEAFDPVTFQATAGVDVIESHPVLTAP